MEADALYSMMQFAAPFEGQSGDFGRTITELMVEAGVLTPNQRDGRPDAWRDYQQILAELGLIYSTRMQPILTFTELGHLFLAGEIGFSEMMGMQALRYQYPNGYKSTIGAGLGGRLTAVAVPDTLTELQAISGVLLKPGPLILRILVELVKLGRPAQLTVDQVQTFLIPRRRNSEWPEALADLLRAGTAFTVTNSHARRNVQDWFKFLRKTDFAESETRSLRLSNYSLTHLGRLEALCESQESVDSFWLPTDFSLADRLSWFGWFGSISGDAQEVVRDDVMNNESYVTTNYPAGFDEAEPKVTEDSDDWKSAFDVNPTPIDLDNLGVGTDFRFDPGDINALLSRLAAGAQKKHAKTLLHDQLVKQLAVRFEQRGASLAADPNSVDLLARWPDGTQTIFEVKTVTRRTLPGRLRTALGQIQEYGFRLTKADGVEREKVVAVNTKLQKTSWQTEFLTTYLGIGLICLSEEYTAFCPDHSRTSGFWS